MDHPPLPKHRCAMMKESNIQTINLTLFGKRVKTSRVFRRTVVTIPADYAERLGIVEGVTDLEVTVENGALVYRPIPGDDFV